MARRPQRWSGLLHAVGFKFEISEYQVLKPFADSTPQFPVLLAAARATRLPLASSSSLAS